jgi:peptidoglycan hydrolase-like protein with peptidoglycan-binding domain
MTVPNLKVFDGFPHTTPALKPAVIQLQRLLISKGYKLTLDGFFSASVQKSVQDFQQRNKLPATGAVDANTWVKLGLKLPSSGGASSTAVAPSAGAMVFRTSYPANEPALTRQLAELNNKYAGHVREVSKVYRLPACVIAGIGSRESAWALGLTPPSPDGTGDHGHGRGLLQVDDRWHTAFTDSGKWADPRENLIYGAALLRSFIDYFVKAGIAENTMLCMQGAVASYNAGPRRTLEAVQQNLGVDFYTTGRNYSADTLNRSGWFQSKGW